MFNLGLAPNQSIRFDRKQNTKMDFKQPTPPPSPCSSCNEQFKNGHCYSDCPCVRVSLFSFSVLGGLSCLKVFQWCFKKFGCLKFQGCFQSCKGIYKKFQGRFKGVSRKLQECFKEVSGIFQRCFK